MVNNNPNQPVYPLYDPSSVMIPSNFVPGNEMFINQPGAINSRKGQRKGGSSFLSGVPSLFLPALILLAFSWILHAIATFIPYWSTYSGISDSRAGLWSARNFDYYTIQNFYFPEPNTFPNITNSVRFTGSHTKGYLITVQFLMTFNFCVMFIVIVLLAIDYVFANMSANGSGSFLIRSYNTSDTALKFGLLLYIIYVFGVFEFAAWITYVGSRHDNNWHMHVSFAFAIIVSAFLIIIFIMYIIEFLKTFKKNRLKWQYWYGRYIQWGFFVYLSALLLMLTVICCPEWGYIKVSSLYIFGEIGLFKQCYLSEIYKDTISPYLCTLSNSHSNQSWVNATQAFMLMAYIIDMIILIVIVAFRREFLHNEQGYYSSRVSQPTFTYIIAGLILFFGFIFTLIAVAIFGGEVFHHSIDVNWAYIVAVFAMVLFLITGILFILDAFHSQNQASATSSKSAKTLFFPAPLNYRVLAMQPLIKPKPARQQMPPLNFQQNVQNPALDFNNISFFPQQNVINPAPDFNNTSFFPQQQMMMMPTNYGMEQYPFAPVTQAILTDYFRQMQNNPQLLSSPYNQGLMNYSDGDPLTSMNNPNNILNNNKLTDMVRQEFIQQQRLNYNHERLLERYSRLTTPRIAQFRTFGSSSLPGRNYDEYLRRMRDEDYRENSVAAQSRAGIGSSDETYRWMGDNSYEPLPRDVNSIMQYNRNGPMSLVEAENFEPVKMYHHPIFGLTPAYIRPLYKKIKDSKAKNEESENEIESNNSDHEGEIKTPTPTTINDDDDDDNKISDHIPLGYISYQNWKTKYKHLFPVNPLLFTIYTQRSNGSIQSYGQSLYVPSGYHNRDRRPSHYNDISILPRSNTDPALADAPDEASSSSNHRYHKLHSQLATKTVSHRLSEPFTTESNGDLSGKEIRQPNLLNALLSQNNSNILTSSTPSTSRIKSPMSTAIVTTGPLSTQNTSTMNNAGLSSSSSSTSNLPVTLNIQPVSLKKPESVATSIFPYPTHSSTYNDLTTAASISDSTQTLSNQRKMVSVNNTAPLLPVDDVISSSSNSDDDKKKKHRRQKKKKSATATDGNADVNSSSSDD